MKIDWLWLFIGVVFALFVFPMITAWWGNRKGAAS